MLTMMRNMLRSKAAGGLFVILIVAMAAWGVTDIFAGGSGSGIISSGDRAVTDRQFDAAVERVLINASDDQGRSLTKEQALDQGIIDQVFRRKQTEVLVTAYADKLGMSATKAAIDDTIRNNTVFQDATGLYSADRYLQVLRSNSIRPEDYRSEVEIGLTLSRLRELPIAALKAPTALARLQASYDGERRSARYFVLNQTELPEIEAPSEDALRELYDTRSSTLREPERRAISLVRMSVDDFIGSADVPEDDIVATYEAFKTSRFSGPDSRRYTVFRFADEDTARAALGRIAGGADAENIDTAMSAQVQEGTKESLTNARLSEQVFNAAALAGSIHGPQPEGNSFMVVRLESITPGDATPLDDVRETIQDELARAQAANLFYDIVPQFDDLLGTGADLETIATQLGVPVLSFAPVDQSGVNSEGARYSPLLESAELLASAFNKSSGDQTERFSGNEVTWIARVDAIIPESMPEFEAVEDDLRIAWRQNEERDQLQNVASTIETALSTGEQTLEVSAAAYGGVIETLPEAYTRRQSNRIRLPGPLINSLFSANNVGDIFTGPGLPGQYVIMEVTEITRPDAETVDLLADTALPNLQNALAEDLYDAYFQAMQAESNVAINGAAYEAYKQSLRIQP